MKISLLILSLLASTTTALLGTDSIVDLSPDGGLLGSSQDTDSVVDLSSDGGLLDADVDIDAVSNLVPLTVEATVATDVLDIVGADADVCINCSPAGGGGDPHFARWGQEHESFHGECDLVMVRSKNFHNGIGLDLHARTTIHSYFSFIETAALRVGENIVEFHKDEFFIDGHKFSPADLPVTFGSEYKITEVMKTPSKQKYKVDLHEGAAIFFKFYKEFLTIHIDGNSKDFDDSVGLLGAYGNGDMVTRAGGVAPDFESLAFDWQVHPEDMVLFRQVREPQLPYERCRLPSAPRPQRRRLRANTGLLTEAQQACGHVTGNAFNLCVDDVITTGDIGLASEW